MTDIPTSFPFSHMGADVPSASRALPLFCLVIAGLAGLAGMTLGIFMGISQDFSLAPVHAHTNLLGWVSMALYGLYHRGVARAGHRLAWAQASASALGLPLMTGGLAGYLLGLPGPWEPAVILGSLLSLLGLVLFFAVLLADRRNEVAP